MFLRGTFDVNLVFTATLACTKKALFITKKGTLVLWKNVGGTCPLCPTPVPTPLKPILKKKVLTKCHSEVSQLTFPVTLAIESRFRVCKISSSNYENEAHSLGNVLFGSVYCPNNKNRCPWVHVCIVVLLLDYYRWVMENFGSFLYVRILKNTLQNLDEIDASILLLCGQEMQIL